MNEHSNTSWKLCIAASLAFATMIATPIGLPAYKAPSVNELMQVIPPAPEARGGGAGATRATTRYTGRRSWTGILVPDAAQVRPRATTSTRTAMTAVTHCGCQRKREKRRSLFSAISCKAARSW